MYGVCPIVFAADSSPSVEDRPPSLAELVTTHAARLSAVASDPEAIAYFSAHLGPALRLHEAILELQTPVRSNKTGSDPLKHFRAELVDSSLRLVVKLVTWHWLDRVLQTAQGTDKNSLPTWLDQSGTARKWLTASSPQGALASVSTIADTLVAVADAYPAAAGGATPPCTDYSSYLDKAYPALADQPQSWLTVMEQEGLKGLKVRLEDESLASGLSLANQRLCARLYLETRLFPVFRAHLIARSLTARAEVEREAQALATALQRWPERKREILGLARLCGTWQWSIHNHRHHQDTKTTMTFPPPDGSPPTGLRPSKMVVLGDVVYLRWDFQGGFQEESLLFGGEGARLEGSFVNSTGAWGSITGKRIAACPR